MSGTGRVLMLCTGDALPDFLTLNVLHISKHALFAEVFLREIVGRQSCRVIGRQRDRVMEDARALGWIGLEGADTFVASIASGVLSYSAFISSARLYLLTSLPASFIAS